MANFRILHTESSYGLGGQEYRVVSEAKEMGQRGHYVVIAAPGDSQIARKAKREHILFEPIPVGLCGWGGLFPRLLRIIKKHRIQFIHTHGSQDSWIGALAGRLSVNQPVIVRTRHKSTPVSHSLRHILLYRVLPHAVTTTGEAVRQQLISNNHLAPHAVTSIPTGVDMNRFQPGNLHPAFKRDMGIQEAQPVVGTISFLRPEKGIDVLIEAVSLLKKNYPQIRCLIVGTGQEREALLERIHRQQLEESVFLTGFREDIPELLKVMDVFVLPSLEEGMPQSLLQALAMERAVVASSVGGVPEVVHHGETGFLVPPREPAALAQQVDELLREPGKRTIMGQAGRQIVARDYSIDSMLNKTEQLYAALWDKRNKHAA